MPKFIFKIFETHAVIFISSRTGCVALHNFLRSAEIDSAPNMQTYCPPGYADENDEPNGAWRTNGDINGLINISHLSSNMHSRVSKEMRDQFAEYFANEGALLWQNERIGFRNPEINI